MRHFFTGRQPETRRILLVESGSRYLFEALIPGIYSTWGADMPVDLVTCFPGLPRGFNPETTKVYRVQNYQGDWRRLVAELKAEGYAIVGIICAAEPIMTKWKWALAFSLPAKVFVLNENGDYFWIDYLHWKVIRHFVLFRAGLTGAGAPRTIGRLLALPLTILFLASYAGWVHLRRAIRLRFQ